MCSPAQSRYEVRFGKSCGECANFQNGVPTPTQDNVWFEDRKEFLCPPCIVYLVARCKVVPRGEQQCH
jgi:hypothetical protein